MLDGMIVAMLEMLALYVVCELLYKQWLKVL